MRKYPIFNFTFILFLLSSFSLSAQQKFVSSIAAKDATYLTVDSKDLVKNFLSSSSSQEIEVTTNLTLHIQSNETWCEATVNKGTVRFSVEENSNNSERTALVTIYGKDNKSAVVKIIQLGTNPSILVNETSFEVDQFVSKISIGITSNVDFSFEVPDWITGSSAAPAIGFDNYEFILNPINNGETKEGDIVIKTIDNIVPEIKIPVKQTHVGYPTFAVISDVHFGNSVGEGPMVKVPQALKNITSHGKLDALFVVGDLTESGAAAQYAQLVQVFGNKSNFTNPVDTVIYMLGNHDNYASRDNYVKGLKPLNNNRAYPLDQYIVIKGYPFITISQRSGDNTDATTEANGPNAYPKAVQDQLREWLERAAAECPGKPIFVFTHVPAKYTCYGSWPGEGDGTSWPTWSMKVLNPILNEYPQAVVFSGHSHFPIGDPRSIHQGVNPKSDKKNFFTGINLGSTTYSEIHRPSVDIGIHPENYAYVTEGLIVTAQESGDVEIRRYDTYRNEEMHPENPWMLKAPHDGSMFQYADTRDKNDTNVNNLPIRTGSFAPDFAKSAVVTLENYSDNSVTLAFPQANDDEYVFRYVITIKNKSGAKVTEASKFSQFYLNSAMPETLSVTIGGLSANTTYTAEVVAYDSYDNKSNPIISNEFTTGAYKPGPGTSKPNVNTRVLDVVFNADGTATDASSLKNTIVTGATRPTTYLNETYNLQTAKLTGNSSCFYKVDYQNNATIKNAFTNGFSFEALYMVNTTSGTMSPISAQESGGAGIEQSSNFEFWVRLGSSYTTLKSTAATVAGKYCHLIAVYDKAGEKLKMYLNGNPVGEMNAPGTFSFPSNTAAQWIAIGGDASTGTTAQSPLNGEIAVARMYNKAVTRDEVYWMYKEYDVSGSEEPEEPEDVPTPTGSWLFDDTSDLLKASSGNALIPGTETTSGVISIQNSASEANIVSIAGPTASNKAITVPKASLLKLVHGKTSVVDSYTIMYDIRIGDNSKYHSLLQTDLSNSSDGDFFINKSANLGLNLSGFGYGNSVLQTGKWYRVVWVVENGISTVYLDGLLEKAASAANDRWKLAAESTLLFADDDGEDNDIDVAEIGFWDTALTAGQIAGLGTVE